MYTSIEIPTYPIPANIDLKPAFPHPKITMVDKPQKKWFNCVTMPTRKEIQKENIPDKEKGISVVMCNWKYTDLIPYAISEIMRQGYSEDKLEVIVVDDNSQDHIDIVMDILKAKHDTLDLHYYKTNKNVTYNIALAFNIGMKRAKHELVINSPADMLLLNDYLKTCSEYFSYFDYLNVEAAISPLILTEIDNTLRLNIRDISDCGLTTKRENYMRITGYDERFRGWGGQEPDILGRMGMSDVYCGLTTDLIVGTTLNNKFYNSYFNTDYPERAKRKSHTTEGFKFIKDNPNGKLNDENYAKGIFAPNKTFGELDTLEQVF